jgi:nucleoside-diphosphate-sugar epimerase
MATIAVTGATGFIGRSVSSVLRGDGHEVRGFARSTSESGGVQQGNVLDASAVRALVDGCDAAVHLAPGIADHEMGIEEIVEGTRNMVAAVRDAGVKRLIYMSCLGAVAGAEEPYFAAKWRAETIVKGGGVLSYTILRPSVVLGRGDGVVRPLVGLLNVFPAVPVPATTDVRFQPIDVLDVARCVAISVSREAGVAEEFSLGGPIFLTFGQLVDLVGAQLGISKRKVVIPEMMAPFVARMMPAEARSLFGGQRLAVLTSGVVASPGVVERYFDFQPASVIPTLASYAA